MTRETTDRVSRFCGFLWRAHFWTTAEHPAGEFYGGYSKFIRAWTPWGARRLARIYRHQKWTFSVERWPK